MKIRFTINPEEVEKIIDTTIDMAGNYTDIRTKAEILNYLNDNEYEVENNIAKFKGKATDYEMDINIDLICRIAYRFMPVIKMAEGIFCFLKSFVKDVEDMIGETKTLINGKTSEEYWQEKTEKKMDEEPVIEEVANNSEGFDA